MTKETAIAVLLAPVIGTLLWWLALQPGQWARAFLYRRLPAGILRRLLLSERHGKAIARPRANHH